MSTEQKVDPRPNVKQSIEHYAINYNWGDPREPEWNDGALFLVLYQDKQRQLTFKIFRNKTGEKSTEWRVVPPQNIRISFKGDDAYLEVCDIVVYYLKTKDFSEDSVLKSEEFLSVTADLSEVPGRFSTQLSLVKEKYRQLKYAPKFSTLSVFLVGFSLILLHRHNSESLFYNQYLRVRLFILGALILLMLALQIKRDYRNTLFMLRFHASQPKLEAIKLSFTLIEDAM